MLLEPLGQPMKDYYELHITFVGDGSVPIVDGWSHSAIAGDIILGDGSKQYLTMHAHRDSALTALVLDMEKVADRLSASGRKVLRTKVERVVYDNRRGK